MRKREGGEREREREGDAREREGGGEMERKREITIIDAVPMIPIIPLKAYDLTVIAKTPLLLWACCQERGVHRNWQRCLCSLSVYYTPCDRRHCSYCFLSSHYRRAGLTCCIHRHVLPTGVSSAV